MYCCRYSCHKVKLHWNRVFICGSALADSESGNIQSGAAARIVGGDVVPYHTSWPWQVQHHVAREDLWPVLLNASNITKMWCWAHSACTRWTTSHFMSHFWHFFLCFWQQCDKIALKDVLKDSVKYIWLSFWQFLPQILFIMACVL